MTRLIGLVLCVFLTITGQAISRESPRTITWDDLIPKDAQYPPNPLDSLNSSQLDDIDFILGAGDVMMPTELGNGGTAMEVEERFKKLHRSGIDVDQLIARLREAEKAWRIADEKVDTALDGQLVRMPGYILPLEYSGSKVIEFLLVPFVGACIHVPPPPPNQIVHVTSNKGFKAVGLYTPVYVTGYLTAKGPTRKSMFLKDGNVNVDYGYSIRARNIQLFKEEKAP